MRNVARRDAFIRYAQEVYLPDGAPEEDAVPGLPPDWRRMPLPGREEKKGRGEVRK